MGRGNAPSRWRWEEQASHRGPGSPSSPSPRPQSPLSERSLRAPAPAVLIWGAPWRVASVVVSMVSMVSMVVVVVVILWASSGRVAGSGCCVGSARRQRRSTGLPMVCTLRQHAWPPADAAVCVCGGVLSEPPHPRQQLCWALRNGCAAVHSWVQRLLLARGVAKALAMADALRCYSAGLRGVVSPLQSAARRLQALMDAGTLCRAQQPQPQPQPQEVAEVGVRETAAIEATCSPFPSGCQRFGQPRRLNDSRFWQGGQQEPRAQLAHGAVGVLKVGVAARRQLQQLRALEVALSEHCRWLRTLLGRHADASAQGRARVAEPL
jgi:hypothetical protein